MWDRTLRNFPAASPLYKIAADNIFPARVSLMWGWLDHDLLYPQCKHAYFTVTNVPRGFVVVPGHKL